MQATTRYVQQELVDLGFMDRSGLTGAVDMQTSTAVLGFQKWIGLPRDGSLGPAVIAALERTTRPEPKLRKPGRRIEVQLRRQLALLIEDNRVIRAVHISSGAYGKTPSGSFRVYRKERYSWSVPFKVWLPWASYFTGGVAFHEFGSVPTYAASHGCIRVNHYDAQMLFGFAEARHARSTSSTRPRREQAPCRPALAGGLGIVIALVLRRHRRCGGARRARAAGRGPRGRPARDHVRSIPQPTELVVALKLGDPVLQAGAVRDGGQVILARGLEVEIARALAQAARDSARPLRLRAARLAPARREGAARGT